MDSKNEETPKIESENLVVVKLPYNAEILISIEECLNLVKAFKNARGASVDYDGTIKKLDNTPIQPIQFTFITNNQIKEFKIKNLLGVKNE